MSDGHRRLGPWSPDERAQLHLGNEHLTKTTKDNKDYTGLIHFEVMLAFADAPPSKEE